MDFKKKLDLVKITDEELIKQVEEEYNNALEYRRPAVARWHKNEAMLYGDKPPTLSGRSNIDLKLMKGFETTLLSKIKTPLNAKYSPVEEADLRKAKKVTALWEVESSPTQQDWAFKDFLEKKLALPSGRSITKIISTSPYRHYYETVDHYDFLVHPRVGGYSLQDVINKGLCCGQDNIFRSKAVLKATKKYDQERVKELIECQEEKASPEDDNAYKEKANRFYTIGLNPEGHNLQFGGMFRLLEWITFVEGVPYYVLCNIAHKIIVKRCPLEDVTGKLNEDENPVIPFVSWAYFPDLFNFWSLSPMDDVRENFMTRNVAIGQAIDNNEAKNRPQKIVNTDVIKDVKKLKFKPDSIITMSKKSNMRASEAVYAIPTPDIYDPVKLNNLLEDIAGKVSGVIGGSGIENPDQKVGIHYSNVAESADKMDNFELSYNRAHIQKLQLYLVGLQRLTEPMAVKIIGENGTEADKLFKEDLTTFDIIVSGGLSEAKNDEMESRKKAEFFKNNAQNPNINQKWRLEEELKMAGYSQADIKRATEKNDVDEDLMSRASEDIQNILNGKIVKPHLKANVQYLQKFADFIYKTEITEKQEQRFASFIRATQKIVIRNLVKKAKMDAFRDSLINPVQPIGAARPGVDQGPLPNTPGATISRASEQTNNLKGSYVQ